VFRRVTHGRTLAPALDFGNLAPLPPSLPFVSPLRWPFAAPRLAR
jgi:hypothetical protein